MTSYDPTKHHTGDDSLDSLEAPAAPPSGAHFVWNSANNGNFVGIGWLNNGILGVPGAGDIADFSVTGSPYTVLAEDLSITSDGGTWTFNNYTVGQVILGVDTTLEIDSDSFTIQTSSTNSGVIKVDTTLTIGDGSSNVVVMANGGSVVNGGWIELNPATTNATLTGATSTTELDLESEKILGGGSITGMQLTLDQNSSVVANSATEALTINTGASSIMSQGALEAFGSGTLIIESATIVQAPLGVKAVEGAIEALAGGTVELYSTDVLGGYVLGGNSTLEFLDAGSTLDGSTVNGAVTVIGAFTLSGGDNLTLRGTISNEGVISLSGGTALLIDPSTGVTLNSGASTVKGVISLDDNVNNTIQGNGAIATLTNVDNTIKGSGQLINLNIINEAGGVINASGATQQLYIATGDTLKNSGLVEATGAAGLYLASETIDAALGGTVKVFNGSLIDLASDTFQGGTISAGGTGKWVLVDAGTILDGSTASGAVTLTTAFGGAGGDNYTLKGTIHNEGTLSLSGGTAMLIDPTAGVTLDSGGKTTKGVVTLDDNVNNSIQGNGAVATFTNVDNTIKGSGQLINLNIVNEAGGVINASGATKQLYITTGDTLKNSGLVEATGAAGLYLASLTIDGSLGGTVKVFNGSVIDLASDTFQGGTISAAGTGKWVLVDAGTILDGSTASGAVTLTTTFGGAGGDNYTLKGTIHNEGTLSLSGGTAMLIDPTAGVTLDSGGKTTKGVVTLDDNVNNSIQGNGAVATFTNVDNTIKGSGQLINLNIVNEAGGVIDATGATQQLYINTGDTLKNSGLVEATGAAGLYLGSLTIDGSLGGTITVGDGSLIDLASVTYQGGTISATGTGKYVLVDSGTVLDGSTASGAVTLTTTFGGVSGDNFTLKGTIHNEGTLSLTGGTAMLIDPTAGVTLDSGGKTTKGVVTLDDNVNNSIQGNGAQAALINVDNTIEGSGQLINLNITNQAGGTIDASGATQQLYITTGDKLTNAGLVEATGAAGLSLASMTIQNAGGTNTAANKSHIVMASIGVTQGTISTTGTGYIEVADTGVSFGAGAKTNGLTLAAKIEIDDGAMLAISGSVNNTGEILVGNAGGATLELGATLNGSGSIMLDDSSSTQIVGGFNNVSETISGAGTISARIQQQAGGVIEAIYSDNALILSTGLAIQNGGVLEANGGMLDVKDAVTGAGSALITNKGSITFESTFNENVTFSGAGALALTGGYTGTISGFGVGDTIELLGKAADSVSLNGSDQLIVKSGTKTIATLQLSGTYTNVSFVAVDNGSGVEIVEVPAPTVAAYLANKAAYEALPNGFAIADTAANIQGALAKLAASTHLVSITSTSGTVTSSVFSFKTYQSTLDKIVGGFAIQDNSVVIGSNLDALAADNANILSISVTSGVVFASGQQFGTERSLLNKIVGGFKLFGKGTTLHGLLSAIKADLSHIVSITTTGGSFVNVTTQEMATYQAALDKVIGGYVVADTAANIKTSLAALEADAANIHAIKVTQSGVGVTAAMFNVDQTVLDKIKTGFGIADSAASIENDLVALAADAAHIVSLKSTTTAVTVNDVQFEADKTLLDKTKFGFTVKDSGANILGDLTALSADTHISHVATTDGPLQANVAALKSSASFLNKITGGFDIADAAATVQSSFAAIETDTAHILAINATGGELTFLASAFVANETTMNKVVGGVGIKDTTTNIINDGVQLLGDLSHIQSVFLTDVGTPTITLTAQELLFVQPVLAKISNSYVLNDQTSTGVITTGHGDNLTIADVPMDDMITGGGVGETFVFGGGFGQATITDFSANLSGSSHDTIQLSKTEFGSFSTLTTMEASQHGSDIWLQNGNDKLVLSNLTMLQLNGASGDFKFA